MPDLLSNLNPEQKQAALYDAGPLLIVAGAGTGKTAVITQKIAHLIAAKKCATDEILALTFTEKAAEEMSERVDQLLPFGYLDLWIYTFHGFCQRVLNDYGLEIGLPSNFKLLDNTAQWLLARQNLDRFNLDYYRPLGSPTKFIHALLAHFSRAKDENITPADYGRYVEELKQNVDSAEFIRTIVAEEEQKKLSPGELKEVLAGEIKKQEEIANAYHIYQQLLLANEALDFGDLINYCLKLFSERKNILARYRQQFKYLLVDEFQDTNWAQYELLKLLKPQASDSQITVVGDDDQAIYKFRGAAIANILRFKEDYRDCQEIFLTQNYRSQQNILDLAYNFIQKNNPERLEIKLAQDKKLSKKLMANVPGQAEIIHYHAATLAEEVGWVVKKIVALYNQGPEIKWSDFAILVRANSSADDFIYQLEQAKAPYLFLASRGLYNKPIVLDLLAFLRLLDNYHENPAVYRLISLPLWSFSHADICQLIEQSKKKAWSLFETLKQSQNSQEFSLASRPAIEQILNLVAKGSQLVRENKKTTEVIQFFLKESGYLQSLTKEDTQANRRRLDYLNQFYQLAEKFEKENADNSPHNFLAFLELELTSGEAGALKQNWEESDPDTVKIMTVHGAKGLEFKYVFVGNLVDKKFPSVSRGEAIELPAKLIKETVSAGDIHLAEERRLFYVALTRAKEGLYLTSAADYGGARKKKISRFLLELAEGGLKLAATGQSINKEEIIIKEKEKSVSTAAVKTKSFSFTQIKAFESCPYQYRFAHVLKIPTRGKAQLSYGKSLHNTLEQFFQLLKLKNQRQQGDLFSGQPAANPNLSWEELLNIYQKSFIVDWYENQSEKEAYFAKGKAALKAFWQKYDGHWPPAEHLEFGFNFRLAGYPLKGKIDRIDRLPEGLKIIDYKTGSAKKFVDDKDQLLLYQIAVQTVLKEKVKELAFYYLDDNEEKSFLGEEKDLKRLEEKIIKIIEEIKRGQFLPQPGHLCQFCDFRSICEFKE